MDIASLRIKFTPLLKNFRKGSSKCCLEIVPEVSAIHNLHRIEWALEDNLVEYRIPMTYKIILKKPKIVKEAAENLDKTYYSCVDLLSGSITNFDMASGDIKRILSDNFELRTITTDIEQCNVVLSKNKAREITTAKTTSVITLDVKPNSVLREPLVDYSTERLNIETSGNSIDQGTNLPL